jgi:hypothetical protein
LTLIWAYQATGGEETRSELDRARATSRQDRSFAALGTPTRTTVMKARQASPCERGSPSFLRINKLQHSRIRKGRV